MRQSRPAGWPQWPPAAPYLQGPRRRPPPPPSAVRGARSWGRMNRRRAARARAGRATPAPRRAPRASGRRHRRWPEQAQPASGTGPTTGCGRRGCWPAPWGGTREAVQGFGAGGGRVRRRRRPRPGRGGARRAFGALVGRPSAPHSHLGRMKRAPSSSRGGPGGRPPRAGWAGWALRLGPAQAHIGPGRAPGPSGAGGSANVPGGGGGCCGGGPARSMQQAHWLGR